MQESQAQNFLAEQARKKRGGELFLPALALFGFVLYWLNGHGWRLTGPLRDQALGIAALAAAIFWFGAMRAGMPAMSALLLGPVWILLIGDDGTGWIGFLAVASFAGWKREGWELPWKVTLLALGSWYLSLMLASDMAQLTGLSSGEKGVRQLALLSAAILWASMIMTSLPLWIAAAILAGAYYWRVPGASAALAWVALMAASFLYAVFRRKPAQRRAGPAFDNSGARFATSEEMQSYRYD